MALKKECKSQNPAQKTALRQGSGKWEKANLFTGFSNDTRWKTE